MDVQQITSTKSGTVVKESSKMGKDEFLKILVTQLQYQDPMNPMEDTEFIAQMAQFSSLEQMQNLNESVLMSRAVNLIGKNVIMKGGNSDTGENLLAEGIVEGVYNSNGTPYLKIGESYMSIDDVQGVSNAEVVPNNEATGEEDTSGNITK